MFQVHFYAYDPVSMTEHADIEAETFPTRDAAVDYAMEKASKAASQHYDCEYAVAGSGEEIFSHKFSSRNGSMFSM